MIKHIVMWKLAQEAEGVSLEENAETLKKNLKALPAAIPEIIELDVGLNESTALSAWDVVLSTTFENWDALRAYQAHPDHQQVARLLEAISVDRHVVDYET